jgi:hypothetical protein
MREYYYLSGLDESPYQLTLADALHLGAACGLPIYTFIEKSMYLHTLLEFDSEVVHADHFFVRVPFGEVAELEKISSQRKSQHQTNNTFQHEPYVYLKMAIVDDRYVGTVPIGGPFRKNSEWPVKVELYSYDSCWDTASMVKIHPSVGISELLCFTEDLDDLVRNKAPQGKRGGSSCHPRR